MGKSCSRRIVNGKSSDIIRIDSVDEEKYLDDKRERFARAIVAGEGLLSAYRNAFGASAARDDELAMNQAITLARVPQVANRITQLESERRIVRNITRDSMIADLKNMADVSISDYFNVSGGIWEAYRDWETDRKSTRLNSSHSAKSRMPSSA